MSLYPTVLGRTSMPAPTAPKVKAPAAKPLTDLQVAQQAIQPVIDQITGAINARSTASANAVKGYTDSLARELAGTDYGAPYSAAIPQQAAVDEAFRAAATGQGSQLAQQLASRLASIQEPGAVGAAASNLASRGAGIGATELGHGSASLSALLADEAAAQGYGAKMPGIAKQGGVQALGQIGAQAANDIASQTAPIYAKIPDIEQSIASNRVAAQDAKTKAAQVAFENQLTAQEFGLKAASTKASIAQGNARVSIAAQNADTSARRLAQQALNSDRSYQVNLARIGISKRSLQLRALAQDAKLHSGGFTAGQVQRFKGTALTLADNSIHGFTDAKGTAHPALSYKQAVLEGQKEGIPLSILLPALKQVGYVSPAMAKRQQQINSQLFPTNPFAALEGQ